MAPAVKEPSSLAQRSTAGPNPGIIIVAVVGGVLSAAALVVIVFALKKRSRERRGADKSYSPLRINHKQKASDASAAPLLHSNPYFEDRNDSRRPIALPVMIYKPTSTSSDPSSVSLFDSRSQWKEYVDPYDVLRPSADAVRPRKDSADSVETVKAPHAEQPPFTSGNLAPRSLSKPNLAPLSISPSVTDVINHSNNAEAPSYASLPSSAASDDSESLYSQASAPNTSIPFSPPPLPSLIIPQYAYTQPERQAGPSRSDTQLIGKLLKERARYNPNKVNRSSSHIERAGSIKPAVDDSDNESGKDDNGQRPIRSGPKVRPHRARPTRSKSRRRPTEVLVPMVALQEAPESASSQYSFSNKPLPPLKPTEREQASETKAQANTKVPDLTMPPPVSLLNTSWVQGEISPPLRPYSLLPPRLPEHIQGHRFSRSVDHGYRDAQKAERDRRTGAHMRQHSAERSLGMSYAVGGRQVSTYGIIVGEN